MAGKRAVCSPSHANRRCVAVCEACWERQLAEARLAALVEYVARGYTDVATAEQRKLLNAATKAVDDGGS